MKYKDQNINEELLAKFLLGETNREERDRILLWLEEKPENSRFLDQLETLWLETGKLDPHPIAVNQIKAWRTISSRIEKHEKELHSHSKSKTISITIFTSIAASILLMIGIFNWYLNDDSSFYLANNSMQSMKDSLPDGSQIYLNQSSEISFTSINNERIVDLKGEAFFKVKRDTLHPFIVRAGMGGVKVLGTSFQVKRHKNGDISVDVNSGVVDLFKPIKSGLDSLHLILRKNESGLILGQKDSIVRLTTNASAFFWVDKRLSFRNKQLKDVFRLLETCYQIKILTTNPEINDYFYTSTFIDEDAEDVIKVITQTHNLSYKKEKNVYTIFAQKTDKPKH